MNTRTAIIVASAAIATPIAVAVSALVQASPLATLGGFAAALIIGPGSLLTRLPIKLAKAPARAVLAAAAPPALAGGLFGACVAAILGGSWAATPLAILAALVGIGEAVYSLYAGHATATVKFHG